MVPRKQSAWRAGHHFRIGRRAEAVARKGRSVHRDYVRKAMKVDREFGPPGGLADGVTGPVEAKLAEFGRVRGFVFGANGELKWNFDGGDLLQGETDGSSYMNGGLRVRRGSPTTSPD